MTSIVIPLGNGSKQNNLELRYCLRSIEQYLSGVSEVFIIGECPDWVQNVIHIPAIDDPRTRYRDRNIMQKMVIACKDKRVSDDFLMVHDDHFLLSEMVADDFPYYYEGYIEPGEHQYGLTKANTIDLLCPDADDRLFNYDVHCPILFNKEKFMGTVALADWNKWYGYCLKTMYCILNGVEGEQTTDLKIRYLEKELDIRAAIKGRKWFSIGDKCFNYSDMKIVLEELYPNKSKYERP